MGGVKLGGMLGGHLDALGCHLGEIWTHLGVIWAIWEVIREDLEITGGRLGGI